MLPAHYSPQHTLPLTRTESYFTSHPFQKAADIQVYQGEDDDALKNILVGDFTIEGLTPMEERNEILCRMRLDLDGILEVTAVEKRTGKSKQVTISNAMKVKSAEEMAAARKRIKELYQGRGGGMEVENEEIWDETGSEEEEEAVAVERLAIAAAPEAVDDETAELLARSRGLLEKMHGDDREEAIAIHERIESALEAGDAKELQAAAGALRELLFFVEGQRG